MVYLTGRGKRSSLTTQCRLAPVGRQPRNLGFRGAARAKGGIPIITLPSTAKDGGVSRIVPTLQPGAGVVTSRGDVHYVITEHGVAYLHGKTIRQRAEALIAIADPKFQGELEEYARKNRLLSGSRSVVAV